MYSEIALHPRVREFLETFDRPIRVLDGRFGVYQPNPSWRGQSVAARSHVPTNRRPANVTAMRHGRDEGLTIVSRGLDRLPDGMAQPHLTYWASMERPFYAQRTPYEREWLAMHHDEQSVQSDYGTVFARVDQRTVFMAMNIGTREQGGPNWDGLDLDALLGVPIRRALEQTVSADELRAQEEAAAIAAAREQFLRIMQAGGNNLERLLAQYRSERSAHERQLASYERYITTSLAAMQASDRQITATERTLERLREQGNERDYSQEWDRLIEHPKVTGVSARGDTLLITTTALDITDPRNGRTAPLGRFRIEIGPPTTGEIQLHNLEGQRDGRDHPHVEYAGPCFGGSHRLYSEVHASGNYPALLELLIQYLETFNPDDCWGRYAYLWFDDYQPEHYYDGGSYDEYDLEVPVGYDPDCGCDACADYRTERNHAANAHRERQAANAA